MKTDTINFIGIFVIISLVFGGILGLAYHNDHSEISDISYSVVTDWTTRHPEIQVHVLAALADGKINRVEYNKLYKRIDKIRYGEAKDSLLNSLANER